MQYSVVILPCNHTIERLKHHPPIQAVNVHVSICIKSLNRNNSIVNKKKTKNFKMVSNRYM